MRGYRSLGALIATLMLAACNSPTAPEVKEDEHQPVREFFFAQWDSALTIQHLEDSSADGNYRIKIIRESITEPWVLETAERLYPTRQTLEGLYPFETLPPDIASLPDTASVWWLNEFDGTRIPVANTAAAVQYYLDLSYDFGHGDFSGTHGFPMLSSSFTYFATAAHWEEFRGRDTTYHYVDVAQMTLVWDQYCGPLCAMYFESSRIVILGYGGKVLEVIGDGPSFIIVS